MLNRFRQWRAAKVRAIGRDTYIRFTPSFGFSFPWGKRRRIRYAAHHGLQLVEWREGVDAEGFPTGRWVVARQLLGRSTVKGERYIPRPSVSATNISSIAG
jgi:hypothetical protein